MQMKSAAALVAAACLAASAGVAHHSYAMFDNKVETTLIGTVKEFQWTNPHSWIQLMVTDAAGHAVEWSIEGGSPVALAHQGWTPTTFTPGDKVEIVMHPLKDGRKGGSLLRAIVNGQKIGNGWTNVRP
ncbi:MAG: DUF6152 family protein [Pseudomonadota bacterium]|nr:DUF6152 family protein [Pseudomonadota bacterium]